MKPRHSCWGFFYASTRYEIRDTRYEIRDTRYEIRDTRYEIIGVFTIELFEYGFVEGDKKKKYRGIAGGTIPRVPMTPSLAAGVIWQATSPLELN
ncbi:hypothetical protein VCHA50O413_10577 [Vibrio chagasii]|nr:hypothetical protein VCHA50O409_10578 [Vibrio chagasii]CAH7014488.1 hypothetical protein VCHA50O402_10578 [Vibrio chagasii]CAH7069149.1 hypothetical protein VCHA50O413_10577 [Vibrio chagasii]CAH7133055.1 hypothetical protein VCHA50P424_10598 [Vibrio chagasii]CAH7280086.1 hypothetical protein VCHA50O405_40340 [Vibrio chagasii]